MNNRTKTSGALITAGMLASFSHAAELFEVIVDTKDPVEVGVFDGSCKRLAEEQKKQENVLKTKIAGFIQSIKGEQDCTTKGSYKLKAKDEKNNKRDSMKVGAGQWIMAFKDITTPSGFIPAICIADPKKPGRILRLYTPKLDSGKTGIFSKITGRSGGFGLACEQVTVIPK